MVSVPQPSCTPGRGCPGRLSREASESSHGLGGRAGEWQPLGVSYALFVPEQECHRNLMPVTSSCEDQASEHTEMLPVALPPWYSMPPSTDQQSHLSDFRHNEINPLA